MGLDKIRQEIDGVDTSMRDLFLQRMRLSAQVVTEKKKIGGSVYVPEREVSIIENRSAGVSDDTKAEYQMFLKQIMGISRTYQYSQLDLPKELSAMKDAECIRCSFVCEKESGQLQTVLLALTLAGISVENMSVETVEEDWLSCQMQLKGDFGSELSCGALLQVYSETQSFMLK